MKILQFGRSMIEMLGVLAIIGVLSIGGLTLYRRAIDTHKANSIFDDVNRFEFVISERIERLPHGEINVGDFNATSGFTMTAYNEPDYQRHYIMVSEVPENVCRILLEKGGEKYTMYAYNRLYEGDTSICDNDGEVVTFYFGETGELCTAVPDTENNEVACSNGCRCADGNVCKSDRYNPTNPRVAQLGSQHTVCCEDKNTVIACHDGCADTNCPEHMFFDYEKCECVCTNPDTMIYDAEEKDCVCRKDSNNVQLVPDNGKCVCPDAGYTLSEGICSKIDCRDGTTGNTFRCYIDSLFCGWNCDSTGHNCDAGVCYTDDCGSDEVFIKKKRGNYSFACQHKVKDDYICYIWNNKQSTAKYDCYRGDQYCCSTRDRTTFKCNSGLCGDETRCTNLKADAHMDNDACYFKDGLKCEFTDGQWKCFKHGYYCGNCEEDAIKNDTCCLETGCKVQPNITGLYNSETKRCEYTVSNDVVGCTTEDSTYHDCYIGDTLKCKIGSGESANYAAGRCPEVAESCPKGTRYEIVQEGYYDCKNQAPNAPVCMYIDNRIICYYNGTTCGEFCDYFGQNCSRVMLPQCATAGHCPQNGYDMGVSADLCTCDGAVTSNVSVTVDDGNGGTTTEKHSFCCPANHTYVNGGCTLL